jgi:hypothetical protein
MNGFLGSLRSPNKTGTGTLAEPDIAESNDETREPVPVLLGPVSLEPSNPGYSFYRRCLDHIYERQGFRSVLAGAISGAVEGWFGSDAMHSLFPDRVQEGDLYLRPVMAVLWALDVTKVAERPLITDWIGACRTATECYEALESGRGNLGTRLRDVENLPRHEDMRC